MKAFSSCGFVFKNEKLSNLDHLNYRLKEALGTEMDWDAEAEICNFINGFNGCVGMNSNDDDSERFLDNDYMCE